MIAAPFISFACAVCFGNPDSLSSKSLLAGIFFLAGVIVFVLSVIAWTALIWAKRARSLES